eukprot:gene1296-746_t
MEIESVRQQLEELLIILEDTQKSTDDVVFAMLSYLKNAHLVGQLLLLEGRFAEMQRCLDLCRCAFVDTAFQGLTSTESREEARRLARVNQSPDVLRGGSPPPHSRGGRLSVIDSFTGSPVSRPWTPFRDDQRTSSWYLLTGNEGDRSRKVRQLSAEDRRLLEALQDRTAQLQRLCDYARDTRDGRDTQYYIKKLQLEEKRDFGGHSTAVPPVDGEAAPEPPERGMSIGRHTKLNQYMILRDLPALVTSADPFFNREIDDRREPEEDDFGEANVKKCYRALQEKCNIIDAGWDDGEPKTPLYRKEVNPEVLEGLRGGWMDGVEDERRQAINHRFTRDHHGAMHTAEGPGEFRDRAPLFVPQPQIPLPEIKKHILGYKRRSLTESFNSMRAHRSPSTGLTPYPLQPSDTEASLKTVTYNSPVLSLFNQSSEWRSGSRSSACDEEELVADDARSEEDEEDKGSTWFMDTTTTKSDSTTASPPPLLCSASAAHESWTDACPTAIPATGTVPAEASSSGNPLSKALTIANRSMRRVQKAQRAMRKAEQHLSLLHNRSDSLIDLHYILNRPKPLALQEGVRIFPLLFSKSHCSNWEKEKEKERERERASITQNVPADMAGGAPGPGEYTFGSIPDLPPPHHSQDSSSTDISVLRSTPTKAFGAGLTEPLPAVPGAGASTPSVGWQSSLPQALPAEVTLNSPVCTHRRHPGEARLRLAGLPQRFDGANLFSSSAGGLAESLPSEASMTAAPSIRSESQVRGTGWLSANSPHGAGQGSMNSGSSMEMLRTTSEGRRAPLPDCIRGGHQRGRGINCTSSQPAGPDEEREVYEELEAEELQEDLSEPVLRLLGHLQDLAQQVSVPLTVADTLQLLETAPFQFDEGVSNVVREHLNRIVQRSQRGRRLESVDTHRRPSRTVASPKGQSGDESTPSTSDPLLRQPAQDSTHRSPAVPRPPAPRDPGTATADPPPRPVGARQLPSSASSGSSGESPLRVPNTPIGGGEASAASIPLSTSTQAPQGGFPLPQPLSASAFPSVVADQIPQTPQSFYCAPLREMIAAFRIQRRWRRYAAAHKLERRQVMSAYLLEHREVQDAAAVVIQTTVRCYLSTIAYRRLLQENTAKSSNAGATAPSVMVAGDDSLPLSPPQTHRTNGTGETPEDHSSLSTGALYDMPQALRGTARSITLRRLQKQFASRVIARSYRRYRVESQDTREAKAMLLFLTGRCSEEYVARVAGLDEQGLSPGCSLSSGDMTAAWLGLPSAAAPCGPKSLASRHVRYDTEIKWDAKGTGEGSRGLERALGDRRAMMYTLAVIPPPFRPLRLLFTSLIFDGGSRSRRCCTHTALVVDRCVIPCDFLALDANKQRIVVPLPAVSLDNSIHASPFLSRCHLSIYLFYVAEASYVHHRCSTSSISPEDDEINPSSSTTSTPLMSVSLVRCRRGLRRTMPAMMSWRYGSLVTGQRGAVTPVAGLSGASSSSNKGSAPNLPSNNTLTSNPNPSATLTASNANLPCPYPIDGGHVPIYSIVRGIIQKRNWIFRNPEWCDLCREPVAVWANHHGRKDHALMDQHYTALVEYSRRWNPEELLEAFTDDLGIPMDRYHEVFQRYDRDHHNEIFAMLKALEEGGVLYFGEPRNTFVYRMQGGLRGMDHQGALVLHQALLGPLMRLYPDGHIQDFSNLVDFITCAYNMETVYDLCGMAALDEVAKVSQFKATSPAAMGLGGASASSSATTGFQQDVLSAAEPAAAAGDADVGDGSSAAAAAAANRQKEASEDDAFSRKAVFVRQILGQLRWLTLPGPEPVHPAGYTFPPHLLALGEMCVKALVVEIIGSRICEYMVRAEPVWRSFGFERKKLAVEKTIAAPRDVLPQPVRYHYRPMAENMEDLFSTGPYKVDEELEEEKKRSMQSRDSALPLPLPPAADDNVGSRLLFTLFTLQPSQPACNTSPPPSLTLFFWLPLSLCVFIATILVAMLLLQSTRCLLRERNELYSKSSSLPADFYKCCHSYFQIKSHLPTYVGTRDSQVRGLFLSTELSPWQRGGPAPAPVEANTPLLTIPLDQVYTETNISSKPNTLRNVTVEQVRQLIPVPEFKLMAPQLYMGLQFAAMTSAIPQVPEFDPTDASGSSSSIERYVDIQAGGANPWSRMLEDEDFNENFILNMYGGALDKWQRENFDELTSAFHRCISAIHEGLQLRMKIDHLRRTARLVLARVEHVPPAGYWDQPRWRRRLAAAYRRARKRREPSQLAMIPMLDLVNHSNRPNCGVRIGPSAALQGRPAVTLFSLSRILPGQELCRHYNFSLTRPVALFRYGFLPFDLISIVELDPANEYLFKNQHQMRPPEEAQRIKEEKEKEEPRLVRQSTHPIHTPNPHTQSTHPIHTPNPHTQSTHPIHARRKLTAFEWRRVNSFIVSWERGPERVRSRRLGATPSLSLSPSPSLPLSLFFKILLPHPNTQEVHKTYIPHTRYSSSPAQANVRPAFPVEKMLVTMLPLLPLFSFDCCAIFVGPSRDLQARFTRAFHISYLHRMSSTAALAAYALASLAKPNPTPADVEAIAKAVKINIPKETLNFVFESIAQRDVNTLIAEGATKMSAMAASAAAPAGGAAPAAAAGAAAAPAAGKAAAKVEEESDDDIGFGLFD